MIYIKLKEKIFKIIMFSFVAVFLTNCDSSNSDINTISNSNTINGDVNLISLSLSSGSLSPAFEKDITSYTAEVPTTTSSITVIATASGSNLTIKINDVLTNSGSNSQSIALSQGSNTITITVTSEDNTVTKTYTLTITRLIPLSSNANLSNLKIYYSYWLEYLDFSPMFSKDIIAYTAELHNDISYITVIPTIEEEKASIKINGITVISGTESQKISLMGGGTNNPPPVLISIVVTAEDTTTNKTYNVTVFQGEFCNNGVDDDGDALTDCADPDCGSNAACF